MLAKGLGSLFGGGEDDYGLGNIPGQMKPYFDPFIQAGQRQLPGMEDAYNQMMGDPGGFINKMGGSYQKSPGFDFALKQALQGAGHAAAAGGMAGSPQHEQWAEGIATGMANQDYNQWLDRAMGAYGRGLGGREKLYEGGMGMSKDFGLSLGQLGMTEAQLKAAREMADKRMWGDMFGAAAKTLPFFL